MSSFIFVKTVQKYVNNLDYYNQNWPGFYLKDYDHRFYIALFDSNKAYPTKNDEDLSALSSGVLYTWPINDTIEKQNDFSLVKYGFFQCQNPFFPSVTGFFDSLLIYFVPNQGDYDDWFNAMPYAFLSDDVLPGILPANMSGGSLEIEFGIDPDLPEKTGLFRIY